MNDRGSYHNTGGGGSSAGGSESPVPPPVSYRSSADLHAAPYEGERSIAAALHMKEIVPKVMGFLTVVELMFVKRVSAADAHE